MSLEVRLGSVVTELATAGLRCLVMGGHAVRYYGIGRNTADFDLHLAPENWNRLAATVRSLPSLQSSVVRDGPSWRPESFRRFEIGKLPDGREEWLEFWKGNHLLPPFQELWERREVGIYGGHVLPFLSLSDLIRSKETERNDDWQDITLLEEILDQRLFAAAERNELTAEVALSQLRSRRGLRNWLSSGRLNRESATAAAERARWEVSIAFLLPLLDDATAGRFRVQMEPVIFNRLRTIDVGSSMHLSLVEAVRRQYKLKAQLKDRADKEEVRKAQQSSG